MLCGKDNNLEVRNLAIHHIDYDKKNNNPPNCVTLCINCHGITGRNRKYWKQFFQDLLSDRYKYNYNGGENYGK